MKFKALLRKIKQYATAWARKAFKAAIVRALGITGGWKLWLASWIISEAFEEVVEPFIKLVFRNMGYAYDRIDGHIKFTRIEKAKEDGDEKAYDIAVDDVFR